MDKATQVIREQAAEWVIRFNDEALTQADTLAFVAWLRASPVHIREYLRSESAWFQLEDIDQGKRLDVEALLQETPSAVVQIGARTGIQNDRESMADTGGTAAALGKRPAHWWRMAAAMLVAIALPAAYFSGVFGTGPTYATSLGEQRTVVLVDGSVLELNTATAVEVRYSQATRDVNILNGEAFFTVKKDASRPFRVYSNAVEVKAVGTQFNVYRHGEQTVVTVLEGKVEVQRTNRRSAVDGAAEAPIQLGLGSKAVITADRQSVARDEAAMARALAWREHKLIFADEPLVNVVEEINRYNAKQLVVTDPSLAARRISGVFNIHDPEVIVRFLARSAGVTVQDDSGNAWVLAPTPP